MRHLRLFVRNPYWRAVLWIWGAVAAGVAVLELTR